MTANQHLALLSTQYALAMLIGQDLDLETMLRRFMPPALKQLHCRGGHLWLCDDAASPQHGGGALRHCTLRYCYPRVERDLLRRYPAVAAAIHRLSVEGWPAGEQQWEVPLDGATFYLLRLGGSGVLGLHRVAPFSAAELAALAPILLRLEHACRACLQYAEVERLRSAAEAASRAKSEFLANISHEIRTPMHAIVGMADLLSESMPEEDVRGAYIDTLHRAANRLLGLIDDVLDLARLETGQTRLDCATFDLAAVWRETLAPQEAKAQAKGLAFCDEMAAGVPRYLCGDAGRLRQILEQLVDNAIKFTDRGGVTVRLYAAHSGGGVGDGPWELCFEVSDTGVGIPPEQQEMIFDLFTQADASFTRRHGGAGVGLALCRRLVNAMGGTIHLESRPGAGADFRFTVRLYSSEHDPALSGASDGQSKY